MIAFLGWFFLYMAAHTVISVCALPAWVTAVCTCLYTACLLLYFWRKETCRQLLTVRKNALWFALPLFVFALANIVCLRTLTFSVAVVSLLMGAVVEELLFRGVLLSALSRKNLHIAVWGSAVLFGVYHLFSSDLFGAVCALCFGFALAVYAYRFCSLLPCIVAHLLTNLFGNSDVPMWLLMFSSMICVIYGCMLYPRKKEN